MKKPEISIALLIPYFGKWPEWIALYFETLKKNDSIDFHFFTDCDISVTDAPNVFFHVSDLENYAADASQTLGVNFKPANAYKLCDLRPFFGIVHSDVISAYDFFGWTDVDLLFGDIRSFYTEDILTDYDVISAHAIRVSGHLALLRNNPRNISTGYKIYNWKEHLEDPHFVGIDEHGLTNALTMTLADKVKEKLNLRFDNFITRYLSKRKKRKLYLKEQYTTPFTSIPWLDGTINSQQPETWMYRNGEITNARDGARKFIYIHFMNYKSSAYRADGTTAPWNELKIINYATVADMNDGGIEISPRGLRPL